MEKVKQIDAGEGIRANKVTQAVPSFTQPFGYQEIIRKPSRAMDWIPVLDLIVVALFLSLLFTRFVVMPGVQVDLPRTEMQMQHDGDAVAILTVGTNQMLFFNNAVFDASTIGRAFVKFIDEESEQAASVLLVKVQSFMDMQTFMDLCELAQEAGFGQVQIVGQKEKEPEVSVGGLAIPQ